MRGTAHTIECSTVGCNGRYKDKMTRSGYGLCGKCYLRKQRERRRKLGKQ